MPKIRLFVRSAQTLPDLSIFIFRALSALSQLSLLKVKSVGAYKTASCFDIGITFVLQIANDKKKLNKSRKIKEVIIHF